MTAATLSAPALAQAWQIQALPLAEVGTRVNKAVLKSIAVHQQGG